MRCDDQSLEALLDADEGAGEFCDVATHIESCERCQMRLGQLAAEAGEWQEARQWLTARDAFPDGEAEANHPRHCDDRRYRAVAWTEAMASQLLAPPSHPEMLGRIGRYEVERLIGAGGMGVVFKAFDTELNRPVVVKVLAPHLAGSGTARSRFAREARAAAAVVDEHVVAIHNVETEGESPFLVMQYVAGESLQTRLDRRGPLDVREVLRIAMQTSKGLAAAHAQGLIHRDVKPSNILLEESVERALLTDFGLARAGDDASLTHTGYHPGTPQYMSPEQARGEPVDQRSDLFSLGSVMYTMCTGRLPFRAETSYGILRRITDTDPRPIRETNPDIPNWLCEIIDRLMEKRREDRFVGAGEVADLLAAWLAHLEQPEAIPPPERIIRPGASAGGGKRSILRRYLTGAAFAFIFFFAGIVVLLEWNKGTLRIECDADDVPVRIAQGDTVVEKLTVSKSGTSVRVAAGQYTVEIDGAVEGIAIDKKTVTLRRHGNEVVRIVHSESIRGLSKREESSMPVAQVAERNEPRTIDIEKILARRKECPADDPRRHASVGVVFDKEQYFLGENMLLHYRVSNGGDEPFTIEMGGDSGTGARRPLRFKVFAVREDGALVRDPFPGAYSMGGPLMSREIQPGKTFWLSLPLMRYCDFANAGEYQVIVYHDLGWDAYAQDLKNELPRGEYLSPIVETKLRLVMPTQEDARGVLERALELPKNPESSFGTKARDYADFTTLRYPVYLPLLKSVTDQGDERGQMATMAIGQIGTPEATSALIDLLKHPNPVVAADAQQRLLFRLPYPQLEERRTWSSHWDRKYRLVRLAWKDEHRAPVLELGWELLESEDRANLMLGANILLCLGEKDDFPRLLKVADRVLTDMALDEREQFAYPRPGSASGSTIEACWQVIERGARVPRQPESPGELALFMRAVGLREDFRPENWEQVAEKAMRHPIPYIRAVAIENLPRPIPKSLYDAVKPRIQDDAPPVQHAALEAAAATASPDFLDAVMKVRQNSANAFIREAANRAMRACRGDSSQSPNAANGDNRRDPLPGVGPIGDAIRNDNMPHAALRKAIQFDPTFAPTPSEHRHQPHAIAAWKAFLQRSDLTREQQVFAWWRIGSLAAYNFDPGQGETADVALAEQALRKVHEVAGNLISLETLNTATVYGGLQGKPAERAQRLAKAYRWLFTRTDAMIVDSAPVINHNGYGIDGQFMRGGMRLDTVSRKVSFLRSALSEHRATLSKRITEEIQYSEDAAAIQTLLTEVADVADAKQMDQWRGMLAQLGARAERFEFWLKYADAQRAATLLLEKDVPFNVISTSSYPRQNRLTVEAPAEMRFAIRQWIAQAEQDAEKRGVRGPSRVLTSYIVSSGDGVPAKRDALAIVERAQVIFARYEFDPTAQGERIVRSADKTDAGPSSGPPKSPITLTVSRFWGDAKDSSSEQWIERLGRPLKDGYKLQTLTVTVASDQQDLQTFQRQYLETYRGELLASIAAAKQQGLNAARNERATRELVERIREFQAELSKAEEGLKYVAAQADAPSAMSPGN